MRFGIKPGLERIQTLLNIMGNPHERLTTIHITGTNGKGSVTAMVSQILVAAGFRVGSFTSPHLHSYSERFQIDQQMISESELWELIGKIAPEAVKALEFGHGSLTEFEILTALAFSYFDSQKVDIAVIEAGMGGIADSTNVITPIISAITNVGLDHVEYLGKDRNSIAQNKAGIAKPGIPLVSGEQDLTVLEVLHEKAREIGAPFYRAQDIVKMEQVISMGLEGFRFDFSTINLRGRDINLSLPGRFQLHNLLTALAIIEFLCQRGYKISGQDVASALARIKIPGRLELVSRNPDIVLDVAHNLEGARSVAEALEEIYPEKNRILVVGILDDKDVPGILESLRYQTRVCIVTRPDGPRGDNWKKCWREAELIFPMVFGVESIEDAVKKGLEVAKTGEYLLITGSFMTLDRARKMLTETKCG
ncbi:MAG: bifunctional folylpolyglutamate synthase/dihydrofolate synthase [Syntrophomonadaceae bacterium]|nr:bifunctional folylpolyglutamate synthase/dihydrofolate synthase [Syntrophomonadaceae bacterium]